MSIRRLVLAIAACVTLVLPAVAPAAEPGARRGPVRMNELQVVGTHNSYKRETTGAEQAKYDEFINTPGDYEQFLSYSHPSIPNQLGRQGMRGLELDLFADPQGGLYANPLVRQRLDVGPLPDPAWQLPGTKVLHIADLDYNTTCVQFTTCLRQIKGWSDRNLGHVPLLIMLELKGSDRRVVERGGVKAPPWDGPALDALDAEIRSVFGERDMITPDDVGRRGLTLEESVLRHGWPSLESARGQVAFLMDNDPGPSSEAYLAGRPNLEGRVLFTNARAGSSDAAFIKRNDPESANTAEIADLVRKGYLVRTRSDVPLRTVLANSTSMLEAALASGAQLISTDIPQVGMSARYGSDFVAELPDGGVARCNPINARANCAGKRLEPGPR